MQLLLATIADIEDLYLCLTQHVHQVIALTYLVLDLLLPLDLFIPQLPLFMLELSLLLHLILSNCLFLLDDLPLNDAFMFKPLLPLVLLSIGTLGRQLLLDAVPFVLESPQLLLASLPLSLLFFVHLLPQSLLLLVELLLRLVTHIFHKPLLSHYLIFFKLPEPPLFLDLYHLQLLIELLLPEPLLKPCPLCNLLHLPRLLRHRLPDQLALEPLFVVLRAPPLL